VRDPADYVDEPIDPPPQRETAPLGIKIYCLVAGFVGVLTLIQVLALVGSPASTLGILLSALAVAYLVLLWGLWTLRSWAWLLAMVNFALSGLISVSQRDFGGIVIALLLASYLITKVEYYR